MEEQHRQMLYLAKLQQQTDQRVKKWEQIQAKLKAENEQRAREERLKVWKSDFCLEILKFWFRNFSKEKKKIEEKKMQQTLLEE